MTDIPPPPAPGDEPAASTPPAGTPPAGATPPLDYSAGGYPGAYNGPPPDQDAKTMGMLCHLLAIFTGLVGPLLIWLIKKDTSPFVNDQGKEALNFQLTLLIGYLIGIVTACLIIGYFLIMIVWVTSLVLCIMATLKAKDGIAYRYPFAIRMIK